MNHIILKGRLTKDVEIKTTTSGTTMGIFSIAVNRDYVKDGEERQADFFNCTCWNKQAEFISKYFKKGQEILLQGRLQNRTWDDDNGQKHYATDVIVEKVEFCGNKQASNETPSEFTTTTNSMPTANPMDSLVSAGDDLPF